MSQSLRNLKSDFTVIEFSGGEEFSSRPPQVEWSAQSCMVLDIKPEVGLSVMMRCCFQQNVLPPVPCSNNLIISIATVQNTNFIFLLLHYF